jgi:hypothetical protein
MGNSGGFPVNFSGITDSDGNPSTFTVGGWFRLMEVTAAEIFSANGQLTISCDSSGCKVLFGDVTLSSGVPITDTNWHFVAVTYTPVAERNESGTLSLYIDGLEVSTEMLDISGQSTGSGGYVLGLNSSKIEFVSWTIWSLALPSDVVSTPQWGDPQMGTEADNGLVAAFDFANGTASDVSGNNYPVSVASQRWHTPCFQLTEGQATLASSDTVNPGGGSSSTPSPFSILGWACVPSAGSGVSYPILTNNGANLSDSLVLELVSDNSSNLSAKFSWGQNSTAQVSVSSGEWTHLALTWDGTALTFYTNGLVSANPHPSPTTITTPQITIGSVNADGPWYMQALSIWSTCLDQEAVKIYLQGADPTGEPGCVANFNLITDLGDSINGNALQVDPKCVIFDLVTPVTATEAALAGPAAVADTSPQLLLAPALKKIAGANGIDVVSPVSDADTARPEYAEIAAWFDKIASKQPAAAAAQLKGEFLRNLRIGMALRQNKIQAGTFSMAIEGNDTVGYYHTEAGPQEVYRLSDVKLTTLQEWGITIAVDVISLIASMFGIVTTAGKVSKAVGLLEPEINQLVSAIQESFEVTDGDLLKAKKVAMAVIGVMYTGNLTYSVMKKIVIGNWWSVAFTIANTVLMIVAMIVTDGAALIIRLVQAGVALGQLVYDLSKMPQSSAQPATSLG